MSASGPNTQTDANPNDVRGIIDTLLEPEEIQPILKRAARDIRRTYDESDFVDEFHRRDLEAILTAYRIAAGKDRRVSSHSVGPASKTYETSEVDKLRGQLSKVEPGDEFGGGARVIRDDDRYSRAVSQQRDQAADRHVPEWSTRKR